VPGVIAPAGKTVSVQPNSPASTPTGASIADAVSEKSTTETGNNIKPEPSSQPVTGTQTPVTSPANTTAPGKAINQPAPAATLSTTPEKSTVNPVIKKGKNTNTTPGANKQGVDKTPLTLNYATITPINQGNGSEPLTKKPKRKPGKGRQQNNTAGQYKQTVKPGIDNTIAADTKVTDNDQLANDNQPNLTTDPSTAQQATTAAVDPVKKEPAVADSTKTVAPPIVKKEADKKQDKTVKGLELGLMAGPDLSTVKFGPAYKPGYNFGLQIGYRFSNHWSVNTGIIYTKKFYKADSQDFHYKLPWNYKLENVEGNCSMWEIPVNVRYDLSYNEKRRWFASTGLSTYLMDKEYYDVYYSWNGTQYAPYPIDSDSNSNYLFSIVNLSAGMERSLGKHLSIQAEPYLKIPLKGLGTGSMRMTSYGILFTLKYKPVFNAKRSDTRK
jgi:hypothetical protein